MHSSFLNAAVVAAAALSLAGAAHAATPVDLAKLSPAQQAHAAAMQARQREAAPPPYNYDIRPPVLRRIHVGSTVNVGRKYAQALVALVATDNMTGVHQVVVTLQSPSGNQSASGNWYNDFDSTHSEMHVGVDMSYATENGTWRIYSVAVSDSNNNTRIYDEAELATLGQTTFTVTGGAGDASAPEAQAGGVNLTPRVSRSKPPSGMIPGSDARVGVQLNLVDIGTAGIREASMEFCLDGGYWPCFYLHGSLSQRGRTAVLLTLGGHVSEWSDVGRYRPHTLSLYDHAGNYHSYDVDYGDDLDSLLDHPVVNIVE